MVETYYDVLGVGRDASTDEVRSAYRERLKETHPDVNDAADARRETRRLIEARDVLTDPTEREKYDELGHEGYLGRDAAGPTGGPADENEPTPDASAGETTRRDEAADASAESSGAWARAETADTDRGTETGHTGRGTGTGHSGRGTGTDWGSGTGTDVDWTSWGQTERAEGSSRGDGGETEDGSWRSWDSDRSYAVSNDRGGFLATGQVPDSGTIVTLLAIFLLYPVLLWGATTPVFPVAVNGLLILFAVVIVAFLQSVPTAAVSIFGFWSVVLPIGLVGVAGLDLVSLAGLTVVVGVVFPLGFSILVRSIVRF